MCNSSNNLSPASLVKVGFNVNYLALYKSIVLRCVLVIYVFLLSVYCKFIINFYYVIHRGEFRRTDKFLYIPDLSTSFIKYVNWCINVKYTNVYLWNIGKMGSRDLREVIPCFGLTGHWHSQDSGRVEAMAAVDP